MTTDLLIPRITSRSEGVSGIARAISINVRSEITRVRGTFNVLARRYLQSAKYFSTPSSFGRSDFIFSTFRYISSGAGRCDHTWA